MLTSLYTIGGGGSWGSIAKGELTGPLAGALIGAIYIYISMYIMNKGIRLGDEILA